MFTTSDFREGVLPDLLNEILQTRIMVKNAMKKVKNNKVGWMYFPYQTFYKHLYKMLHARQLGLKMIANVTYG
jgi:DNA polymerase zeta